LKLYAVYHTDPFTHEKKEVGLVLERRKLERGNNIEDLMKVARGLYSAPSPGIVITLE
jgi:hypothetical protein